MLAALDACETSTSTGGARARGGAATRPSRSHERRDEEASRAPGTEEERTVDPERAILCAACKARVARERDRIAAFGSHEHDRVNPGGYLFRIACFARADGAVPVGPPSDEFPWFPNHRWRIVLCGSCHAHLGWTFTSAGTTFFGLVVERIETTS